ncbi:MAG TPA: glycine oxidase ThiO [Leptolyngbyaceae cyanobacterium M33_DOE_097]|uniref:glycine oxidase n=1 Tax=Oscillatoriales cyanobacterium SpSt-418 TaxID=2282169 RepID=A0A7C3PJC8_9CYAN|nr:glycine oxidase ThiO [Leptolyngbyaceae cyanobacterium M33_DOE_097]
MQRCSDVLIIGGGIIGLAIALELRWRGADVTLITRRFSEAATHAAAGMLAPQAEQLSGAMLELCVQSRDRYAEWTQKLEALTGMETGYWPCGILAPLYQAELSDLDATVAQELADERIWCDRAQLETLQPGLSEAAIASWWYPQDGQVDNRALAKALWSAVQSAGVTICEGVEVSAWQTQGRAIAHVETSIGQLQAKHYILATGAWSQDLLPIPVTPRKGQMLSVQAPVSEPLPLQRVLFGNEIYIVPRQDGRIVLGATSENVGFTPGNTPAGMDQLLQAAMRLVPALQDYSIQEFWWGFRPATPDELPILGASPYDNLTLATGHYRNGILLAPITAKLIADWVHENTVDPLLEYFHWSRFAIAQT